MIENLSLLALSIFVALVVIMLTDSLTTAVLMISIIANLLVIYSGLNKVHKHLNKSAPAETPQQPIVVPDQPAPLQEQSEYDSFKAPVDIPLALDDAPMSCVDKTYTIDNLNIEMSKRRFRDKIAMDGATVKNANFYKHHFGDELDKSEAKEWWGSEDY